VAPHRTLRPVHSVYGPTYEQMRSEIRRFCEENPQDLVILGFNPVWHIDSLQECSSRRPGEDEGMTEKAEGGEYGDEYWVVRASLSFTTDLYTKEADPTGTYPENQKSPAKDGYSVVLCWVRDAWARTKVNRGDGCVSRHRASMYPLSSRMPPVPEGAALCRFPRRNSRALAP